jgi:hypothetical protein
VAAPTSAGHAHHVVPPCRTQPDPGVIRWTELETNHGDGGDGFMRIEPRGAGGSRVHVEWSTHPVRLRDKMAIFVLHHTMNPVIARMWAKSLDR